MRQISKESLGRAPWALIFTLLFTSLAQGRQESDPFTPGLRWSRESDASAPWIPGRVQFSDDDQLLWASSGPFGARLEAYSAWGEGAQAPLWSDASFAQDALISDLASSDHGATLYAVTRTPWPGATADAVQLSCYPTPSASAGAGSGPLWSVASPASITGAAQIACDAEGARVCFAVCDSQTKQVIVRWHSGVDGSILAATMLLAGDLDRLVMSADGALTLAASGDRVWIWDSIGALIHYEVLGSEIRFADFDETGEQLLLAHGRRVRLLQRVSGGFLERQRVDGGVNELAACGALSDYGLGWAVAWCDVGVGSARYELYEGLSDVLLAEHIQGSGNQGLQNIPQAVRITPSGERAAFATWGGGGETSELLLLDAAAGELIWSIDLPGSAMDVALDRSGRRIAVAHKETHANQPSAGGAVRLYDTGESDLALSEAPRPGGVLSAECLLPEATMTFFLFGEGAQSPVTLPFVQGEIWVSLQSRFVVRARRPDASGRASCVLPLPIGLEGATIAVQAVGRVGVGFAASETHLGVIPR